MSGRGTSDEATDNIILMALAVWHWWQCQFLNSCSQFTKWTPVAKNCTNCFFLPGPTGNTVEYYVDGKPRLPSPHPPPVKDQGHQGFNVARSASCPSSALATCWLPLLTCSVHRRSFVMPMILSIWSDQWLQTENLFVQQLLQYC